MTPLVLTPGEAALAAADKLTEIRRPCDPQPAHSCRYEMNANGDKALHLAAAEDGSTLFVPVRGDSADYRLPCPWGAPWELLYACEAWRSLALGRGLGAEFHYRTDGHNPARNYEARTRHRRIIDPCPDRNLRYRPLEWGPWQPADTMPVWASRFAYRGRVRVELTGGVWMWMLAVTRVNREDGAPVPPVECQ